MAHPIYTPRVNNNDDEVRLIDILVGDGEKVVAGQALAEIETDKANIEVESDRDGYVLRVSGSLGEMVTVGSVLFWLGETADEKPPVEEASPTAAAPTSTEPTAKARALISKHGLDASQIPASGDRISAADVEAYLAQKDAAPSAAPDATAAPAAQAPSPPQSTRPQAAGALSSLNMEERGMLRSVLWHRDEAVPAYMELEYQPGPWETYATAYAEQRRLLGNPLLALMAHRLVSIAADHPKLNSTIVDGQRYAYENVNLGFTIQVQSTLYLVVVQKAEERGEAGCVEAINLLHRRAIGGKLKPEELYGATVAFSSMERWKVSRHVPILPPHVSLIIAHTVSEDGKAVMGASYDHRVLSGGDTVAILQQMVRPPE